MPTERIATAGSADFLAHLTPEQRRAVQTTGCSLLVSAAAGSGKTTVLAERCAFLVCDLPAGQCCDVDDLLVVTFTEAAAEEMRTRIGQAISTRAERQGRPPRLMDQLYRLDNASISTIHGFCRQLIQRWFPQAGVDPQVSVLDEQEARLLRAETLDRLFDDLYAETGERAEAFQRLLDAYANGRDEQLEPILLSVHHFLQSLEQPERWVREILRLLDPTDDVSLIARLDDCQRERMRREMELQQRACAQAAAMIARHWPIADIHEQTAMELAGDLANWSARLSTGPSSGWWDIASAMRDHKFAGKRRPNKLSEEDKQAYESAKAVVDRLKECFKRRLVERICTMSADAHRAGLECIRPHVAALVSLTQAFDERYQAAKAERAVVDFNDLQRFALRLLTCEGAPAQPSEVARQLQRRYRHVLVDEFQDVDPLQAAILRLVSGESADPPAGNLFAVGDIKQSIYRFRLAEPDLFIARADAFDVKNDLGRLITLPQNFRSRSEIIDAVNGIFRPLMRRSFGGTDYDERAALSAAASYPAVPAGVRTFATPAVELHLLEPVTTQTERADEEASQDASSSAMDENGGSDELDGIQREAYLIARRIGDWLGRDGRAPMHVADRPARPGEPPVLRPLRYGDVAILLRALPHKAEPIAEVLRRMQIPVRIEAGTVEVESTEIHDVVCLLKILDNPQQDIPLAAVMRGRLIPEPFDAADLLAVRLGDREGSFHEAVRGYAHSGEDAGLRDRVGVFLATLQRWRERIRQAPVAQVLWELYAETGYLHYVRGLPGGARRRDHLLHLHEQARQFGRFTRQGLRRFLRFIEESLTLPAGPQAGASRDNVVRIMTVHASKGLEFPVVVLADLHKRFNQQDTHRPVVLDRRWGIGCMAADVDRRLRYPTLLHQLATDHLQREDLSEELRVLYVALTRAREHLLLTGRLGRSAWQPALSGVAGQSDADPLVDELAMETAPHGLAWLLAALGRQPRERVAVHADVDLDLPASRSLFEVCEHPRSRTDHWRIPPMAPLDRADALAALADLQPLPKDEWAVVGRANGHEETVVEAFTLLEQPYPAASLTTLPARTTISELKRRWDAVRNPEERPALAGAKDSAWCHPSFWKPLDSGAAADRGTATHRFLQCLDLSRPCDPDDLRAQRDGLVMQGRLSTEQAELIQLDDVAWFFTHEVGRQVRADHRQVRRELPFVAGLDPRHYDPQVAALDARDVILVRGMVDLLIVADDALDLLDFKTDRVPVSEVNRRAERYRVQMDHYAEAMKGIWHRPVRHRWLAFMHPRRVLELS